MQNSRHNGFNTTTLLVICGVLSSLAITGCQQKIDDNDTVAESHQATENSHEEHSHEEHNHEEHNHEHSDEHHEHDHSHEHDEKGVRHVGKHVHGEAELNAIIDGNDLILELNSPAMNVFGFEHQPNTDEQKAAVKTQEKLLNDTSKLFSIEGGDCSVAKVDVDMPFKDDHIHKKEHNDEQEHNHAEHNEHAHEEKGHHADEHEHKHEDGSVHSDVKASYSFTCQQSKNIKAIRVNVFSNFTGFTKVNTKWINADKQGATTLTKETYTISFK